MRFLLLRGIYIPCKDSFSSLHPLQAWQPDGFISWDFAPGLSFPYPSIRLIAPQIPRPAPSAITSVCKVSTAL